MRSGYEGIIEKYLLQNNVLFDYEPWSIQYFLKAKGACADCGGESIWKSGWYTPDFVLQNGIVLEAKGFFKSKDRTKMLAVKDSWPNLDIRFMFMRDNFISKKKLLTYTQWAEAYGFQYHVGTRIPDKWLI